MIVLLHNDLDAVGCQMCIQSKQFKVEKYFYTNYSDFEKVVNDLIEYSKANNINEILIADLSFAERPNTLELILNNFKNVLHIDHHSYDFDFFKKLNIPKECNYKAKIDPKYCASKLCYQVFKLDNNYLKNLINIIDVYDCWREQSEMFSKAQNLNKYFFKVGYDRFLKEFLVGVPDDYNKTVKGLLEHEEKEIKRLKESNKVVRSKDNIISLIFDYDYFNPIMIQEMKENVRVVIGIHNNILRIRLSQKHFDEAWANYIRRKICNKVVGHPYAFTTIIKDNTPNEIMKECQRISNIINEVVSIDDEIPF